MHNEPLSHGWVQYKVKTKPNLPNQTVITNKASIYFDNNSPIVTNTTTNTTSLSIPNPNSLAQAIKVFPNPTTGIIQFQYTLNAHQNGTLIITDMLGKNIKTIHFSNANNTLETDLSNQPAGLYYYQYLVEGELMQTGKISLLKN